MRRWLVLVVVLLAACNLQTASAPTESPTLLPSPVLAETDLPAPVEGGATPIQLTPNGGSAATRLPAAGATSLPTGNAQALGGSCQVYVVYSGTDPANVISLRGQPSAASPQIVRIPNNARVYQIPGTGEVEAEGYHWLNILYVDASQARYQGWAARDSFMQGGVRDASIATLRSTGEFSPC